MEYWELDLWETSEGVCRVEKDLLKKMRKTDPVLFRLLQEQISQYTQVPLHKIQEQGLLVKVKSAENMWELKFHTRTVEIRFLGCLTAENNFHAFHALYGFKKKDQQIKNQHIKTTQNRIKEFINQNRDNGLQKIL